MKRFCTTLPCHKALATLSTVGFTLIARNNKLGSLIPASDELILRRLYLDLLSRLPSPAERKEFLATSSPDKRTELIDRLLKDDVGFADHWISFWQDLLRDGKQDLGSTDIFRPITPWLHKSLRENKPLDQMTRELINPPNLEKLLNAKTPDQDDGKSLDGVPLTDDDPSGFLLGLRAGLEKPRGDQAWEVQAAQNIAQVFLGLPLKCATCHDSFVDDWTMREAWGLAAIFAKKPLEMVRCELPTGELAEPRFIFPELGHVETNAADETRREQFALLVTSKKNGLYARTLVNRIWAKLFGRGLIDTLEDMSKPSWHADLLDWLAADLVDHDFDQRYLIRTLVTSQAYQQAAVANAAQEEVFVFRGPLVKRMTAEQYLEGIHSLVGRDYRIWKENGSKLMEVLGRPDHRTVVLCRESKASTMQSLELLNGHAIHELIYGLHRELPKLTNNSGVQTYKPPKLEPPPLDLLNKLATQPPAELVDRLMQHALAREANAQEREVLLAMLGASPTPERVGDVVWAIINLPEFQLVR